MHPERINKVADAIERRSIKGLGFNMVSWFQRWGQRDMFKPKAKREDSCGTTACIAGWAVAVKSRFKEPEKKINVLEGLATDGWSTSPVMLEAKRYLGLNERQADQLFAADGFDVLLSAVTPQRAVAVLRHLAKTGVVDWKTKIRKS